MSTSKSSSSVADAPVGGRKATTIVAASFVSGIALGSFALSFAALRELAAMSGIPGSIAWVWPLIVDGSIVTAMLVIFAWRDASRRETAWPWTTLIFFALVSIIGNGVHTVAVVDGTTGVSVPFAVFVGAIPPVSLLLSSEMLVRIMAGPRTRTANLVAETASQPRTTPEPEPPLLPVPKQAPTSVSAEMPAAAVVAPEREQVAVSVAAVANDSTDVAADGDEAVPHPEPLSVPLPEPAPAEEEGVTPVEVPFPGLLEEPAQEVSVEVQADDATTEREPFVEEPVADSDQSVEEKDSAPTIPAPSGWAPTLIEGQGVPEGKDAQIDFIVARARAGHDVSKATLADLLEVSDRTAFRRLADAKAIAPDAFGEAVSEPVIGVAK